MRSKFSTRASLYSARVNSIGATCAASGLGEQIPPDYNLEGKLARLFPIASYNMEGQVYLADALEELSAVPGGSRRLKKVRTRSLEQTMAPPIPP